MIHKFSKVKFNLVLNDKNYSYYEVPFMPSNIKNYSYYEVRFMPSNMLLFFCFRNMQRYLGHNFRARCHGVGPSWLVALLGGLSV